MFADKMQEIEQIIKYINLIVSSVDSKWNVSTNTFSVTISDNGFDRSFSKDELESYEQQIKYFLQLMKNMEIQEDFSNLLNKKEDFNNLLNKNEKAFKTYFKMLNNIRNKYRMCQIESFSVHNPFFIGDQYSFNNKEEDIVPIPKVYDFNNDTHDKFNLKAKDYHSFGKYLLNEADKHKLSDEFYVMFNRLGLGANFAFVDEFIRNNFIKLGSID